MSTKPYSRTRPRFYAVPRFYADFSSKIFPPEIFQPILFKPEFQLKVRGISIISCDWSVMSHKNSVKRPIMVLNDPQNANYRMEVCLRYVTAFLLTRLETAIVVGC